MSKAVVKSRAASLLEKIKKVNEDETPGGMIPDVKPDLPGAAADAEVQPTDNQTEAPKLQEGMINDPEKMADVMKLQEEMCDKFMDEEDDTCYTPGDEDDKKMVSEAKYHLRESRSRMLKMKKK